MSIKPRVLIVALCTGLIWAHTNVLAGQATKSSEPTQVSKEDPIKAKAFAKAVVDEPIFEFEPVLDGETVSHTFVIKNSGNAELNILKVRTG